MLIDFRVRPPYKTNLTTSLYNKPAPSPDPTKQSIFLIGKEEVVSEELKKHTYKKEQIEVVNATESSRRRNRRSVRSARRKIRPSWSA
mgnify:CR=1 FL=1